MADLPTKAPSAPAGSTPPARAGGSPKPKQRYQLNAQQFPARGKSGARGARGALLRGAGQLAKVAGSAAPLVPGIGGKLAGVLGGALSQYIDARKQASDVRTQEAAPPSGSTAGPEQAGGTEAKLAALLGQDGPDAAAPGKAAAQAGGAQSVAVGAKVVAGVLVTPEPYDSEAGPRLAVAARVFGMANALELAVLRLIDLPAGQLLTYAMNRGFR